MVALPASWLWVGPEGQCRSLKQPQLLRLLPGVSTTSQSSSPQRWTHQVPSGSHPHRISNRKTNANLTFRCTLTFHGRYPESLNSQQTTYSHHPARKSLQGFCLARVLWHILSTANHSPVVWGKNMRHQGLLPKQGSSCMTVTEH